MLEKREILETVSLNRTLGHLSLVTEKRKPFDILAERPSIQLSRGDKTAIELFRRGVRDGAGTLTKATEALATNCH